MTNSTIRARRTKGTKTAKQNTSKEIEYIGPEEQEEQTTQVETRDQIERIGQIEQIKAK